MSATVPRKPRSEGLSQFNIRMPTDLISALDAEVEEETRLHPGRMVTRSDLIREILYAHVRGKQAGTAALAAAPAPAGRARAGRNS